MKDEEIKQKYIKISHSDFSGDSFYRSSDSYFRSLEMYLTKNNRSYHIEDQNCIVYVSDKNDATRIGFYFGFCKLQYFDGSELLPLVLISKERSVVTYYFR